MKIIFYFCMFRNVPECSGMFHVPDFIGAPSYIGYLLNTKL